MNEALDSQSLGRQKPVRHWPARLDLRFARTGGKTRLQHSEHCGPLRVQRLFYPEHGGKAHCYLLHPPGGVVLGDELAINICVESGDALVTTPSAGRFYTVADEPQAQLQTVRLTVREGRLEWLPQETIIFEGANAQLRTRIDLNSDAQLSFWDVVVLGKPACRETFRHGRIQQSLEIHRNGRPVLCERIALHAGDAMSRSPLALGGYSTVGTAVFTDSADRAVVADWLAAVKDAQDNTGKSGFSLTQRGDLLLARYLGDDACRAREGFALLWSTLSKRRTGYPPAYPRIWHT